MRHVLQFHGKGRGSAPVIKNSGEIDKGNAGPIKKPTLKSVGFGDDVVAPDGAGSAVDDT